MVPGMQVGLFFLRARRIRNLLRTMTREAGRVPAPRMALREMSQRAAGRMVSLRPYCHAAFIFLASQRLGLGKALTLQYLLATFPQQKIFCTHTTHGGTANRHHGVRCEEDLPHQRRR